MKNNERGLSKKMWHRLCDLQQTEEVRYAVEFERTLRDLEALLHESDNADDIIARTLSTACNFYDANWAGFLEVDMDLGIWAPYVWYNRNPRDRTKSLIRDFEETAIMQRWLSAMENNEALIIPDVSSIKTEEPREYAIYQKLSIQSFIAVPVKPRPLGFLVVRNPKRNIVESSLLKMLAFVTLSMINEKKLMDSMRFAIQPENIRKDTDILVNLFGSLEIYASMGVLRETDIKSQKILRMIAYLLLNRKSSVPPREMAEALWPEESMDIDSVSNNMRGLLYRLRTTFDLICKHNLIERTPNGYRINPKLNIMTDLQQFDKCCDAIPHAISTSEKIELLKQAMRIYKGNVLTSAESEHWLMLTASHYNLKYVGIVNELLRMLADAESYHDLHQYAAQSLNIEPGNIHAYYWLIHAMVHLGSFDLAKSEYKMAQRYLTDEEYKELTDMLRNLRNLAPEDLFYIRKLPDT